MNISGSMRIFKKEYEGRASYTTTIGKKNEAGEYENLYITVQLPKDVVLENNTMINVTKGFLSFYKTRENLPKIKIVIQAFEFENKVTEDTRIPTEYFPIEEYSSDLPF